MTGTTDQELPVIIPGSQVKQTKQTGNEKIYIYSHYVNRDTGSVAGTE